MIIVAGLKFHYPLRMLWRVKTLAGQMLTLEGGFGLKWAAIGGLSGGDVLLWIEEQKHKDVNK
ncbi:MAG: hypothetical protein ACPG62_07940 [Cycloclasticus sp.]